jgi:hypothetical protein
VLDQTSLLLASVLQKHCEIPSCLFTHAASSPGLETIRLGLPQQGQNAYHHRQTQRRPSILPNPLSSINLLLPIRVNELHRTLLL